MNANPTPPSSLPNGPAPVAPARSFPAAQASTAAAGNSPPRRPHRLRNLTLIAAGILAAALITGTLRNPDFWSSPDQRGERLFREGRFAEAAKVFEDPAWTGAAQYRNGDFEAAAKTFARVPGETGAFNQGNAWLMHGQYDQALERYDRALSLRPGWREALENKAIAQARKAKLESSGDKRGEEQAGAYKPDKITLDQKKGENKKSEPEELSQTDLSDAELRATWLRQVRTTPGDFLRAKFAYQAAAQAQAATGNANSNGKEKAP